MSQKILLALLTFFSASTIGTMANAALVNFEGNINFVDTGLSSAFNTTMTVSGSFTVDDSSAIFSNSTNARYSTSSLSANIGGSYSGADTIGGFIDVNNLGGFDNITYQNTTLNDSTFASIGGFDPWAFSLRLDDNTGTALSNTSFPNSLDVADFPNIQNWALQFRDSSGFNQRVAGNLTSISVSPVPIPAAAWLFGTALVGMVGFSRRRKAA